MTPREERGLAIAALCKLNRTERGWMVPSQSGTKRNYRVDPERQTCTCPDHQEAGFKCKHIFAVEFTIKREVGADGVVTETRTLTVSERKTYQQDWPAYNRAQSVEKDRFQVLLNDLCEGIQEPSRTCRGRKPHAIKDSVFASVFKVYSTFSSRRFSSDLREANDRGYLAKPIPGMKVVQFFENPALTPILNQMIPLSAAPLSAVETCFAVDSTGFSSNKFERWYDHKYGVTRQKYIWVKAHISCGVKTNVITAVRILDKDAPDAPQFRPLIRATAENFTVKEASGDKAYCSRQNFEAVEEVGGTAFLAFKTRATGGVGGLYAKMLHYFKFRQEEFLAHYHKRSNIESTFSAVKRKFGDSVRSKTDVAMVNEVLCKFVAHNICCLIQEQHELGIDPVFWDNSVSAERIPYLRAFP